VQCRHSGIILDGCLTCGNVYTMVAAVRKVHSSPADLSEHRIFSMEFHGECGRLENRCLRG
jgi:hypothetical protein